MFTPFTGGVTKGPIVNKNAENCDCNSLTMNRTKYTGGKGIHKNMKSTRSKSGSYGRLATKAIASGVVAGGVAWGFFREGTSPPVWIFGMPINTTVIIGAAAAVGSLSADAAKTYILPELPSTEGDWSMLESNALEIAASGGATSLALNLAGSQATTGSFLLGAASTYAGDLITKQIYQDDLYSYF